MCEQEKERDYVSMHAEFLLFGLALSMIIYWTIESSLLLYLAYTSIISDVFTDAIYSIHFSYIVLWVVARNIIVINMCWFPTKRCIIICPTCAHLCKKA